MFANIVDVRKMIMYIYIIRYTFLWDLWTNDEGWWVVQRAKLRMVSSARKSVADAHEYIQHLGYLAL